MKVLLLGSRVINTIPSIVETQIKAMLEQHPDSIEFIVGDNTQLDKTYQDILYKVGAIDKTTVYCLENNDNKYGFKSKVVTDNADKKLCEDCNIAISIWDEEELKAKDNIRYIESLKKHVYKYNSK